jgi:hypothetical protein
MRIVFQLVAAALAATTAHAAPAFVSQNDGSIRVGSSLGQSLLSQARALDGDGDVDYSFLADYSIKFQGCHHVSQWNADAEDEDDVRIKTKRLVRFRLCPSDSCSSSKSTGCTSKYGDYVVDMNTFVASYLEAIQNDKDYICADVQTECYNNCNSGNDADCVQACYEGYGLTYCLQDDDAANDNDDAANDNGFDAADYSACAQYNFGGRRRRLDEVVYYLGPYCADQGGEIHLGLFTDDTCTTYAQNGESTFYSYAGFQLPYADDSLVSARCLMCGRTNEDGESEIADNCQNIYGVSGKCETKMNVDYPNESACTYIEGIKIIREDGVIRTSATRKSKAAAVCIGLFLTGAVLLAGYVYYLRTKLARAKINLAAAAHTLS